MNVVTSWQKKPFFKLIRWNRNLRHFLPFSASQSILKVKLEVKGLEKDLKQKNFTKKYFSSFSINLYFFEPVKNQFRTSLEPV
jgi:hypothetical protein